jgi:hypothetical protein
MTEPTAMAAQQTWTACQRDDLALRFGIEYITQSLPQPLAVHERKRSHAGDVIGELERGQQRLLANLPTNASV